MFKSSKIIEKQSFSKDFKMKTLTKKFSFLLHEYQAQGLLKKFNINTPKGEVAKSENDFASIFKKFGKVSGYAVKAQVHTGGRGLGHFKENNFQGGVKVVDTEKQVLETSKNMLGNTLVTKQTGAAGIQCKAVYIVEKVKVVKERYLSITLDRKHQCPVFIASEQGGVNIEDTAHTNPEAIKILPINVKTGLVKEVARKYAEDLGFKGDQVGQAAEIFMNIYKVFMEKDCLMIEINPLATVLNPTTGKEEVMVIDSKVSVDDNAAFRQKDIESIIDDSGKNPIEKEAHSYGLNFIRLEGNIGCLVNGAGLAMATMDIIKLHGGSPANFLDVGGGADLEGMVQALRILNVDPQVNSILVNIFGGILRCDELVKAIIMGTEKYGLKKPIVLRLKGTNSQIAAELIKKSNYSHIQFCDDLDQATKLVVSGKRI
jgi:succinyl-CoA synthetase beta subunit